MQASFLLIQVFLMSLFSPLPKDALPGDRARRNGSRSLLFAIVITPLTVWLFRSIDPLWALIFPLEGVPFGIASTAFGAVLAITPVAVVVSWLLALWFGVESVYKPRQRVTPLLDRIIVAIGLVVWSLPSLGFLVTAGWALYSGRVHFPQPARDFVWAEDPNAYLQGVGFLILVAGLCAWFAWRYWQGKLCPACKAKAS
jgi:hypothetical protein